MLAKLSWPEVRHHPWQSALALLAVLLGVALAFAVHLVNRSALAEFSGAVRSVNAQPDFELRGPPVGFDEALYEGVATHPQVAAASPVIEVETLATAVAGQAPSDATQPLRLRLIGIDALVVARLAPTLLPQPAKGIDRFALVDPATIFLNDQARRRLGDAEPGSLLRLQSASGPVDVKVGGSVGLAGPPAAVLDIAGVQAGFGWVGRLSRIDVRLAAGADRDRVLHDLALPAGVRAADPGEAGARVSNVSRAYRVNLTVLALVAMFTGTFLVFSVFALSVAKREPQLALLGVLGLTARERRQLVLAESVLLGLVGSALGLLAGSALAAVVLRVFGGDLGGGYFAGVAPSLQFDIAGALVYGSLGVVAAAVGGWLPARAAESIAPAQALKGLGSTRPPSRTPPRVALLLLGIAAPLALLPPVGGIPLAAYLAVACLLLGGIAAVPALIGALLRVVPAPRGALALLAVQRARHRRGDATIAVAGVVASLALSVAMTVMVTSFRDSVARWLDTVLPADLYARVSGGGDIGLPPGFVERAAAVPGVARAEPQRVTSAPLDPTRPAVALIARPLGADPARSLPLVGDLVAAPPGAVAAYVSEAMVDLYGARPGTSLALPLPNGTRVDVFVRGVWRDYARQHGAVLLDAGDYRRLAVDTRVDDLALWLAPGTSTADVQRALRAEAEALRPGGAPLDFAAPREIRAVSLRIFDRSFAVTYGLQAIAIAIGLFGVAASFSAQVLARRKEFGLLSHLGLTRRQITAVVAAEAAVWTTCGALLGLALGLAVSVVLVDVVNPQSFHWTMDLAVPWLRVGALCATVVAAATLTAWLAARSSASGRAALAVKEDW
nr:ABC transporter permease [Schlegelella koreensis]